MIVSTMFPDDPRDEIFQICSTMTKRACVLRIGIPGTSVKLVKHLVHGCDDPGDRLRVLKWLLEEQSAPTLIFTRSVADAQNVE